MKRLTTYTQGIRGGKAQTKEQGYIMLSTNGDKMLSVDNFFGSGGNYEQRPEPIIVIFNNGEVAFEGTHQQLIEKLK